MKTLILSVMVFSLMFVIGCGGGGGGGGGGGSIATNPAAPVIPTSEDPANPAPENPVNPVLIGNSVVTASIEIPADSVTLNLRSAIRSAGTAYGTAKLYVDGVLFQSKNVNVSNNALTFTFTGVKDSGVAKIEIELFNCSVYGVTKFEKSGNISQSLTLVPDKIFPNNAIKTSEGRVLKEIGLSTADYLGRVCGSEDLTFNELGEPLGLDYSWNMVNFATGQKYFKYSDLFTNNDRTPFDFAYLNGNFYLGGFEIVYKVAADNKSKSTYMGQMKTYAPPVNGALVSDTLLGGVGDMQAHGGKLYIAETHYNKIISPEGDRIKVYAIDRNFSYLSITDSEAFAVHYSADANTSAVVRLVNMQVADTIYSAVSPGEGVAYSIIAYKDGYLLGLERKVIYLKNGVISEWLTQSDVGHDSQPRFKLYKNALGHVYIVSQTMSKLWLVQ